MLFGHIGLGLMVAALLSNQGEVALFGHSTDFIFFRFSESSRHIAVFNLADAMGLAGIILSVGGVPVVQHVEAQEP